MYIRPMIFTFKRIQSDDTIHSSRPQSHELFNDFYIKALVMLSDIVISIEKKSVIKRNKFSMNKNIIILTMTQIL